MNYPTDDCYVGTYIPWFLVLPHLFKIQLFNLTDYSHPSLSNDPVSERRLGAILHPIRHHSSHRSSSIPTLSNLSASLSIPSSPLESPPPSPEEETFHREKKNRPTAGYRSIEYRNPVVVVCFYRALLSVISKLSPAFYPLSYPLSLPVTSSVVVIGRAHAD